MPKRQIKVIQYECSRCGHLWVPRGTAVPTICPKCKSPYWDKPRQEK